MITPETFAKSVWPQLWKLTKIFQYSSNIYPRRQWLNNKHWDILICPIPVYQLNVALKINSLATIVLMKTSSLLATGRGGEDLGGSYPKGSSAQCYDHLTVPGHTHTHIGLVFIWPDSKLASWKQLFPKGVCQKQSAANVWNAEQKGLMSRYSEIHGDTVKYTKTHIIEIPKVKEIKVVPNNIWINDRKTLYIFE